MKPINAGHFQIAEQNIRKGEFLSISESTLALKIRDGFLAVLRVPETNLQASGPQTSLHEKRVLLRIICHQNTKTLSQPFHPAQTRIAAQVGKIGNSTTPAKSEQEFGPVKDARNICDQRVCEGKTAGNIGDGHQLAPIG